MICRTVSQGKISQFHWTPAIFHNINDQERRIAEPGEGEEQQFSA